MRAFYEIQKLLLNKGFDPGPIDGEWGPKTEAAIIEALSDVASKKPKNWPKWLDIAYSYLGLKEIKGAKNNKKIVEFWHEIGSAYKDDETPWCAGFVGAVLEESDIESSRSASARSYQKWGEPISGPCVGCVVVFWRGSRQGWSGHVGFVVGKDKNRNLMVLGGNQGDEVSIKPFSTSRVLSYRWPKSETLPLLLGFNTLPIIDSYGKVSKNES